MRLLRNIFATFGSIDRCFYSRSFMAQFHASRDTTTNLFVVRVPIQEGVSDVDDVDVIVNEDTKEIVLIAKRKPVIKIANELAVVSPISASSSLEDSAPTHQFLEPILR